MYKLDNDKIIFDNNFKFENLPSLGWGSQGDVYKIKIEGKQYALKVFNGLQQESLKNYENKLNIDIDSYISPLKILYVGDKFKGYLMNYCKGKDLEKRNLNISVSEFAESSSKLIEDTYILSLLKYNIYDTFISNVMYDDGFKMIDMDCYTHEINKSIDEISAINNRRLNQMLVNIFIKSTKLGNIFFENVELTKLMTMCNSGKISFESLFNQICMRAYEISKSEIENINDIGKILRKKL